MPKRLYENAGYSLSAGIDLFSKIGYFLDSLVISKVPDTKGDVFNGNYLYGDLVLKLNSRHTR